MNQYGHKELHIYDAANKDKEEIMKQSEPTQIKIYQSAKTKDKPPTILCGDSMKLEIQLTL